MFTIPSSRKLVFPTISLCSIIVTLWLVIQLSTSPSHRSEYLKLQNAHATASAIIFMEHLSSEDLFMNQYHSTNPILTANIQVTNLLSKCYHKPNPRTNHVRISNLKVLNISMIPVDDTITIHPSKQYFNPAIIPLPSHVYATSSYRYLLVSRLVTSGSHQESHICFADLCLPASSSITLPHHTTRECSSLDINVLGPAGGLRCITEPVKVNIPPTPARKCTGAWSTFPDIPGFHDPRIFWSGRGEPLIEINSGSQYGCVGLWLQDLRAVFPVLDDVLGKRVKTMSDTDLDRGDRDGEEEREGTTIVDGGIDLMGLGPPVRYPYVTEITKNPRSSRNEVEKNWILFFPNEDEIWVQYEIMGKLLKSGGEGKSPKTSVHLKEFGPNLDTVDMQPSTKGTMDQVKIVEASFQSTSEDSVSQPNENFRHPAVETSYVVKSILTNHAPEVQDEAFEGGPAKRGQHDQIPNAVVNLSLPEQDATQTNTHQSTRAVTPTLSTFLLYYNTTTSPTTLAQAATNSISPTPSPINSIFKGGRSLAQLISHGHTTSNMTSPLEPSCFNFSDPSHIHDSFNNTGHWHQGSNSLRLVLCTRQQFRSRTCLSSSSMHLSDQNTTSTTSTISHTSMSWHQYESLLVSKGLVVHFSIVHRKFNNYWNLPMRYERYFLVWEARKPFRTIGVSRYPILFGNERARPWAREEDLGHSDGMGRGQEGGRSTHVGRGQSQEEDILRSGDENASSPQQDDESVYFTYTPSIAWSWRTNHDESATHERGHEDLGSGCLGDMIMIGIGMDDIAQGFVQILVDEVLTCLRLCTD